MTLNEWKSTKPGELIQYTGTGPKKGIICVLTGNDVELPRVKACAKGIAVIGPNSVYDKNASFRRIFRTTSYTKWKKINYVDIKEL